jgi:elongation factor G
VLKSFPPAKIRNVALVGHGGAGKTTLAEALLFQAGAISRQGRVEDGTATTDFDPEEIKRKISVSMSLAPFEWEGHKINLLDCPGYADFAHEAIAALRVSDLAVFVVSAVEGVEVQTEIMWRTPVRLRSRYCPPRTSYRRGVGLSGSGRPPDRHGHHLRHGRGGHRGDPE